MDLLQLVISAITNNLANLTVTVVATVGVGYFQYRRVEKNREGKEEERLRQAKDSLIGVLESHLINGEDISPSRVEDLMAAAEREYEAPVSSNFSSVSLLQDLLLKIETSPHLDSEEVEKYALEIEESITKVRQDQRISRINTPYEDLIESIREKVDDEKVNQDLSALEEKLASKNRDQDSAMDLGEALLIFPPALFVGIFLLISFTSSFDLNFIILTFVFLSLLASSMMKVE